MMTSKQLDANHTSATIPGARSLVRRWDGAGSCASGSDQEFSAYISDCRCFSHAGVGTKGCTHTAALFPCSVYLGIQLLLSADAHEARLWPGKGRQADSAEALKGCTIGKVEDHGEEGSGFP